MISLPPWRIDWKNIFAMRDAHKGLPARGKKKGRRKRVVFAHQLPQCVMCGEPWCYKHMQHYADCACKGPMSK